MDSNNLLNTILILEERINLISSELDSTNLSIGILTKNLNRLNSNLEFLKKQANVVSLDEYKNIIRDSVLVNMTLVDLKKRANGFGIELNKLTKDLNAFYIRYDKYLEEKENNVLIFTWRD